MALGSALVVAVCAATPGCSNCRGGGALLSHVPEDAVLVVEVPDLHQLFAKLSALAGKFGDNPLVSKALTQGKAEVKQELGFDPEKPEEMEKVGLDPKGGVVFHVGPDGKSAALAVAVSDKAAMEKFIADMLKKETGGRAKVTDKEVDGLKLKEVSVGSGGSAMAAYLLDDKKLIVCANPRQGDPAAYLAKLAKLDKGIDANDRYKAVKKELGKSHVMLFVDGESLRKANATNTEARLKTATSDFLKKHLKEKQANQDAYLAYMKAAGLALELSEEEVLLKGRFATPDKKGEKLAAIFKGTGSAAELGKFIAPDALTVMRFSLDVKRLKDELMELVPPRDKRQAYREIEELEQMTKLSLDKDILPLLSGRFAMGVFAPDLKGINFSQFMRNPESAASAGSAVLLLQVTDTAKAAELLAKLEKVMVMNRVDVRVKNLDDRKEYFVEEGGKRVVAWTALEEMIVVATGDRLDKTVKLVQEGGDNVIDTIENKSARSAFKADDGQVVYYSISKTMDLLRGVELPGEIKLMLTTVTGSLSKLADLALWGEVDANGINGQLSLRLK